MKVIDLLNKIANGEEIPESIEYDNVIYTHGDIGRDYYSYATKKWFFKNIDVSILNEKIEALDVDDKDIPLIPDDELFTTEKNTLTIQVIDYNFKVLKEKINQVVEELNKRDK